ncbi:ATP-binding protein [Nostoc sp. ChiQUE01b]|uniref:ATP-binding protein n=1 Tax=Nostoc sp. ChiQUE01b TaxID=3075376 RepID=UPI002AD4DD5F|nr:ATP-binding protein [Nostoc sp. ChiQUE01b]MDZ8263173.1 ATP-binding protein [Nostoc sp. ChiQUE01b]
MSKSKDSKNRSHSNVEANTAASDLMQQQLQVEVEQRFGVLPNFFRLAPEAPEITVNLWGFASFAYLDNPLPSLFKERLFVYLSRFCDVRYCITRHLGFLIGLGFPAGDRNAPVQSIEQVIDLLERPLPHLEQIAPFIAQLQQCESPLTELPKADSPLEAAIFACATHAFLQTLDAPKCLAALKRVLDAATFQYLLVFLTFIQTAHYWTKIQTDLHLEADLEQLLATHDKLAELLMNDSEAMTCETSQALMDELISLRQEKERSDERSRVQQQLQETNEHLLHQTRTELIDRMGELQQANEELSDSRRAALNVMEDAIQSSEALRESEEKYRSLFESMDEGYILVDVIFDENDQPIDILYLEANPAAVKMMGTELVGRRTLEINPNFESRWFETFGRVAKTGIGERHEFYTAPLDAWYNFYVFKVDEPNQTRVAAVYQDVSDRKRHDANLVFLAEVSQDLARLTNIDETMNALGEKTGRHFDLSACAFAELYESAEIAVIDHSWHRSDVPSLLGTYRMQEFLTPEVLQLCLAGEDVVIRDVFDDPLTDGEQFAALNIGSFLSIPLVRDGEWRFLLVIYHTEPHDWRDDEIELTRELANRIWTRLERARAEEDLRESEAKYRSLFDSMNEGLAINELVRDESGRPVDVRYLELNPAFERQTGFDRSSALGRLASEVFPDYRSWLEIVERVLRTRQPERFERFVPDNETWFAFHVTPFGPADGFTMLYDDITERKRQEQQQAFLLKLSDALRPIADPVEVLRIAMDHVADHLGVDSAVYHEFDADGDHVVTREGRTNSRIAMPPVWRLRDFGSCFYDDLNAGRTIYYDDTETDPRLQANRAVYRATGIRAGVGVALMKRGRLAAALGITHSEPHHWVDAELRLLEEVAERTWAAVERARAEAALRESEIGRVREQSAREQERQRAETLSELDRAKTLFFSNVSHEFRTPLTLILAPVQDALSDSVNPLTSSQREQLQLAHRNSLRLLKLVNTLLDFSRIEADRLKANYEPTDLSTYTAELASVFRSAIENANLQLVVDCPPLPDPIYVDREMWEKIVLNLLSNALKFTFEGMISVSLKPKANTVELMVSDTGVGISGSELPHLFERFYQVKGAKGRSYEGSGIGLSLVQELVKRHGGAIAVTSAVDQGTTFTVTIPTGIAHLPADQIWVASTLASTAVTANAFVEEALRWLPEQEEGGRGQGAGGTALDESSEFQLQSSKVPAESLQVPAESFEVQAQTSEVQAPSQSSPLLPAPCSPASYDAQGSKRARILLVDDNADMRGYLRRLLNQYYEVEAVNDGLAALRAIRRGGSVTYDLVLADVMMPRMDGFELLRSLRASLNTQTIPIILLSARAGEESRVEGLETGADDYLIKPFSARELLARVNVNLQLAQMRREAVYREQVMQAVQTLNERLEQQVKARTAQLEAINQELEAFSSSVSHDLRTPLRYISSFAERLQGKLNPTLVDASSLQTLNIITKSALEAEKMVDDLLEFSRLGQTEIDLTTVKISQLVQQVREQLQPELIGRSLHWQIEPLPTVEGDPALLLLVLQNLLSNAIKYTHNNPEAAIKIGSIEQEQEVIFFVKDNGAGFDMKYHERLFTMFQRLHPQEEFPGTGVGLATVRRIIHRHGGRIWAEGAIDQGATFYFSLPKHEAE